MKKASIALVMLAGTIVCVGCSSTPPKQVIYDDGKAKVTTGEQSLPADFPIAKYTDGKVELYINSNTGGQKVETAHISTKDAVSTASAFYKNWFTSNGWNVNNETNMGPQGTMLMAEKGSMGSQVMVMQDSTTGGTIIQITVNYKQ